MNNDCFIDEKSTEEQVTTIINEINDLVRNISNSRPISQGIPENETLKAVEMSFNNKTEINQTAQTLAALNSIKTELCRLPIDFSEREYINNCVIPLVTSMEFVARTGFDLATSVSVLTTSPIVPRKKGKLKDTIHTIYNINEQCEDLYKVLKKRLKVLEKEPNCCKENHEL